MSAAKTDLLARYECNGFAFPDRDYYDRHLAFDHVVRGEAATQRERFEAVAHTLRDVLAQRWIKTAETYDRANPKQVYYLSMEFLIGRSLMNNIVNLGVEQFVREDLRSDPRQDWKEVLETEPDAGLGNGASLCALLGGKSVATTMSFTPADGLLMGTRAGSLDPGVLLYLMRHAGMTADALEHLVNHESGLLGVSGLSGDMRDLLASPDPRAAEAVELFVYRIGRELGSLAAALGGLDALVFTGGIGENAAPVRDRVVRAAAWLGAVRVHVIPTDEERMIADHTRRVLGLA